MARVEKEIGNCLKNMIFDRGGEFIAEDFNAFCNDKWIKRQMSAPKTPPQNEIVERRNGSIMDYVRMLMMEKSVSQKYWR